jgi:hypothetical protein
MQQPVNLLSVAPSTSSASQGPNQIVTGVPVSLCTQYGQPSGSNNSIDGKTTRASVASDKLHGLSDQDVLRSAPSSGHVMQGGEAKSSGAASQINEVIYYTNYQKFHIRIFNIVDIIYTSSVLTYMIVRESFLFLYKTYSTLFLQHIFVRFPLFIVCAIV